VKVTWTRGLDEAGRPMRINGVVPTAEGLDIYPSQTGGTNWFNPSFSPRTQLFYVNAWEGVHAQFKKTDQEYEEGKRFTGGATLPTRPGSNAPQISSHNDADGTGYIRALDPVTGAKKWEYRMNDVSMSGILSTATDLVFAGGRDKYFNALDARTGKLLWRVNVGGDAANGPISYSVNGKQYLAFAAGSTLFVYGLK
jgi:alcohol dehydrogenase (cytochrome c)